MYRVGGSWGTTVVHEGRGWPDKDGRREGDEIVGWFPFSRELAERVVRLLNEEARHGPTTPEAG